MNINDTVISLPWSNVTDVTFVNGEDVSFSTINTKIRRLLENDTYLYNLNANSVKPGVLEYYKRFSEYGNNNNTPITPQDLVWNYSYLQGVGEDQSTHINILYPVIPSNGVYTLEAPTKIPEYINSINEVIHNRITADDIDDYDAVLSLVLSCHINKPTNRPVSELSGNIARYDAGYYASINRHSYFDELYLAGYRWCELLIDDRSIENLSAITKNINIPYLTFTSIDSNVSSSATDQCDVVESTKINSYILNDNGTRLMNSYTDGTWIRKFGSGLTQCGGVIQIIPEISEEVVYKPESEEEQEIKAKVIKYNTTSWEFPVTFTQCFNVTLNSYNNMSADDLSANPETLPAAPVYITEITNTGFKFTIKPDYIMNNNYATNFGTRKLSEFNIMWKAEGLV